jgi:uncharacterized alkaline shock family protein YloU
LAKEEFNMAADVQGNNSTYSFKEAGVLGDIQIADEVIAIIAALAATEVEGVAKMYGNITNEIVSKLGMKNLSKGVKVLVSPEDVKVDLSLELKYGYSVMDVSTKVQEKVKQAIETMTGLTVSVVRVRIAGVAIAKEEKL